MRLSRLIYQKRVERGLTQKELAQLVGVSEGTISKWESGGTVNTNSSNKDILARNLKHQMGLHNKTRKDICKDLGIPYNTFSDWFTGKKYPRIDKIEMLANYFGILKADLVEDPAPIPMDKDKCSALAKALRIPLHAVMGWSQSEDGRRQQIDHIIDQLNDAQLDMLLELLEGRMFNVKEVSSED